MKVELKANQNKGSQYDTQFKTSARKIKTIGRKEQKKYLIRYCRLFCPFLQLWFFRETGKPKSNCHNEAVPFHSIIYKLQSIFTLKPADKSRTIFVSWHVLEIHFSALFYHHLQRNSDSLRGYPIANQSDKPFTFFRIIITTESNHIGFGLTRFVDAIRSGSQFVLNSLYFFNVGKQKLAML